MILGGLVPAVTTVLGHHQVLLVLLLEQLLVDLGDVLRDDLRVRVWMSDCRRHGLEIVVRGWQLSEVIPLSRGCRHVLIVLLVLLVLRRVSHLVLHLVLHVAT